MKIWRQIISSAPDTDKRAADIKVWAPRAIATVLWEVGSQFELQSGHQLDIDCALADDYVDRIDLGEHFDVFIGLPSLVNALIENGRIIADSRTPLLRSGMGVAVRAGAPRPEIGTVEAFRRTLLAAKSIAFLNVGGGVHIAEVITRLGLADALKSRIIRPKTDIVSELVAKGDVELGMVISGQILTTTGVQFVGPLPPELQSNVSFIGGVSSTATSPHCSRRLLRFLRETTATSVIRSQGMEPVTGE